MMRERKLPNRAVIPRTAMTNALYDFAWVMWSRTKRGRAELRKAGR